MYVLSISNAQTIMIISLLKVLLVPGDVSKEEDVKNIIQATIKTFGQLNILVKEKYMYRYCSIMHRISKDLEIKD